MKALTIIKYVFTLAGIGMLVGSFFIYKSTNTFLGEASKTVGTVVDLVQSKSSDSTTYRPVIHFTDQTGAEVEFTSSSGSNPPSYSKGEKVEVLYLSTNPQTAKVNDFFSLWGGSVILGGLGGVFFIIGSGFLLISSLKNRKDQYLLKHGTPIVTQFQSVELNRSLSVNGRHPFRVLTQWQNPSTSEVHVFKSNNLWFDPTNYIKDAKIVVYIESDNPKKYFVDLSFLPKSAN